MANKAQSQRALILVAMSDRENVEPEGSQWRRSALAKARDGRTSPNPNRSTTTATAQEDGDSPVMGELRMTKK